MKTLGSVARVAAQAGASIILYAGALVLATVLQSHHDAAVTADRRPLQLSVEQLRRQRQLTSLELQRAVAALTRATDGYGRVDDSASSLDEALEQLAANVEKATGLAARLPDNVPMPATPRTVSIPAPAPATQATGGASGR